MSVNITVNGKFAGHCRSHPLLADPVEVRKAEEKERRKLRLLEVREKSKQLAKKIRDEVNEEKKRELKKLQATKERELECWRQHALQRKGEEYREAIFQFGTAHQAAKRENEETAAKQKQQQGSYKDFKKQMAARKCQAGKVKFSCQPFCPCQNTLPGVQKQFKCTCTQTEDYSSKGKEANKRKRDLSISSSESECEDEGYKEQTILQQSSISLSSTSESTTSISANNEANQSSMFVPTKNKCLIRTPAVHVDVEVGTDDSVIISAPAEIKDKHCEYSRQFSSIIRVSPRKGQQQKENTCVNTSSKQTSTTTTLSSDVIAKQQIKSKPCLEKSQNKPSNAPLPKDKRFTIISELVKKQQENEEKEAAKNLINRQTIPKTITPHTSPKKQSRGMPSQPLVTAARPLSPRKTSATSKSSRTSTTHPLSSLATMSKTNSAAPSGSSNSGRVQFFDYNSKLAKEQDQAAAAISVERQRDQSQPSAMQQAALENEKERERLLEELKNCQISEERGQKALEREQIRRDCNELTEKLEILSREYANQLPSNKNQLHIFADKQLRKEGKMNSAIEKLLQRPSIITCPEQHKPIENEIKHKPPTNEGTTLGNLLNVATLNDKILPPDDVSSDSCCSILLGYVDDQSRLVKQDIQNNETTQNQSKQKRLKTLLKRLDQLRNSLVQELKNETESKGKTKGSVYPEFSSNEENMKQVIDSITAMRKEREQILINENQNSDQFMKREKELQAKEALLDQKVREFYELQKQEKSASNIDAKRGPPRNISRQEEDESSSSIDKNRGPKISEKEKIVCASTENPLEIIITVKGETKCVKIPQKPKRRTSVRRSCSKLSTLIKSPQTSVTKAKNHTPKKKVQTAKVGRQNSYDSNSTSYMSLPLELPTKIDDLAQCMAKESLEQVNKKTKAPEMVNQITSNDNQQQAAEIRPQSLPRYNPSPHINPLIAQYVHRLLGMSRDAVQNLGVSSSDIETPESSIINTTGNVNHSDIIISDERFRTLHDFIEENKSFIKDIEQSIRSQNNVSLENSMRMLDDIWRKRLEKDKEAKTSEKNKKQTDKPVRDKNIEEKSLQTKEKKASKSSNGPPPNKTVASKNTRIEMKTNYTGNVLRDLSKSLSSHYSTDDKETTTSLKIYKRTVKTVDQSIKNKMSTDTSKNESDAQIARYAKLTENCTHRIAELTELINRVREEKQRLLEVTLSSVSDNGRHSTEYLELPEGKSSTRNDQDDITRVSSSSEETTRNKQQSWSSSSLLELSKLTLADKNKQIANSRDSGIADSRPITALENRIDQELPSQTSSESVTTQGVRKMKPPPTLKRFSPQLPEDELAHELSTIFEVDTPATSRINTAAGQSAEEKENVVHNEPQKPVKFPTFEEYVKQLDLDITQLSPEQSLQLQQEFTTFLECLQQHRLSAKSPKYLEFPSINSYIQQLAESDIHLMETLEESLAKLRISGIQPHSFPAVREYIKHNKSKSLASEEQQLLDTDSLENITDVQTRANTDNDTDSMDIQEELKKRKIIKNSFRVTETKKQQILSSTAKDKDTAFYQDILAGESGVEKLSTSGNTSDLLDSDLKRMLRKQQLPGEAKMKSKDVKILSSTTTSTDVSALANSALRAASLDNSSKDTGRAFNLRDFLTRELEKLANNSGSTSTTSSDESLRSHFLHSLIGSLTPGTTGAHTLDRQKTSTPVPIQSSKARSTASSHSHSSNQLFSGESHLSSVHYEDRNSEDANADHSSG